MLQSYNKVLKVNLTTDAYVLIHLKPGEYCFGQEGSLSAWLEDFNRQGFVHPDDQIEFDNFTNLGYLRTFFQQMNGTEDLQYMYRRLVDGAYVWTVMDIVPAVDWSPEDQKAFLIVKDMANESPRDIPPFDQAVRALFEVHEAIFFADTEENVLVPYHMSPFYDKVYNQFFCPANSLNEALQNFVAAYVAAGDREFMTKVARAGFLTAELQPRSSFSCDFRLDVDGQAMWARMEVVALDGAGNAKRLVLCFTDVSHERAQDTDFQGVGNTLLLVEDNELNMMMLTAILEDDFTILQAFNGKEALAVLEENARDIALIVTDLQMPEMDGFELLRALQGMRKYDSIPIVVATASDELETELECLELGASDFVAKPYNPAVILNRVKSFVRLRESTIMLDTLEKDSLTGLYAKEFFLRNMKIEFDQNPQRAYTLMVFDVVGLKTINEKYGEKTGDECLRYLALRCPQYSPNVVCGGRLTGDKLAFLLHDVDMSVDAGNQMCLDIAKGAPAPNLAVRAGAYQVSDQLSAQMACDRALLALEKVKGAYNQFYGEYDDAVREEMMKRQMILDTMEQALEEKQFQVWFQPKHDLHTGVTGGAEALVRWIHPEMGFMNPGMFIPLFEQNGFIARVDHYILEQVCDALQEWSAAGRREIPISVNFSRRDFENPHLVDDIIELVDSRSLKRSLLHVEVTESICSDNPEMVPAAINRLHNEGFVVELDDFGSGYSSLAAMADMDIDVMKLDMSLVRQDSSEPGATSALELSMQIAKTLGVRTVAEGVETEAQMMRVKSLGGDLVQGYYYSRPLPKLDFEAYLDAEEVALKANAAK